MADTANDRPNLEKEHKMRKKGVVRAFRRLQFRINGTLMRRRQLGIAVLAGILLAGSAAVMAKPSTPATGSGSARAIPNATCLACHTHGPGPSVDATAFSHSVHAKLQCTSCHRDIKTVPHQAKPEPVQCGICHVTQARAYADGLHGKLHAAGVTSAPTCATCHGTHDIARVNSRTFFEAMPKRCGSCHQKAYTSYRDTFHGQAAQLGMKGAATCWSCHDPHAVLPPGNPRSRVAPANLAKTCGQCHGDVNANFVKFDVHPDPASPSRSLPTYIAHMFMTGLLIFVFGFFGLHTILWLQRSAVALIRGEVKRYRHDTVYVRRFNLVARLTHITVVVSFMLLALTGLPLMYHDAGWAAVISHLLGGEVVARFVHHVCGVITFGYFFFHLSYLTYLRLRKHQHGMFYGPDSMTPRPQDIIDMFRNFRWFLYLGEQPRLGRWTYWEKFDYWAVFWGVAMIGLSGLAVWLYVPFTHFFSGAYLNVAWVVHGEEALLAVGFIFIFHFFHNHLRPENFPIDVTIFTGCLPLSRFKEERPLEYAEFERTGRLAKVLVPPPSRLSVFAWQVFGYTVVFVGVALIVSVIVAMLR
jgi:cytochrome b subunit of formate dehydrogenase